MTTTVQTVPKWSPTGFERLWGRDPDLRPALKRGRLGVPGAPDRPYG